MSESDSEDLFEVEKIKFSHDNAVKVDGAGITFERSEKILQEIFKKLEKKKFKKYRDENITHHAESLESLKRKGFFTDFTQIVLANQILEQLLDLIDNVQVKGRKAQALIFSFKLRNKNDVYRSFEPSFIRCFTEEFLISRGMFLSTACSYVDDDEEEEEVVFRVFGEGEEYEEQVLEYVDDREQLGVIDDVYFLYFYSLNSEDVKNLQVAGRRGISLSSVRLNKRFSKEEKISQIDKMIEGMRRRKSSEVRPPPSSQVKRGRRRQVKDDDLEEEEEEEDSSELYIEQQEQQEKKKKKKKKKYKKKKTENLTGRKRRRNIKKKQKRKNKRRKTGREKEKRGEGDESSVGEEEVEDAEEGETSEDASEDEEETNQKKENRVFVRDYSVVNLDHAFTKDHHQMTWNSFLLGNEEVVLPFCEAVCEGKNEMKGNVFVCVYCRKAWKHESCVSNRVDKWKCKDC